MQEKMPAPPDDAYVVVTPVGILYVTFPEDGGAVVQGAQVAREYFDDWAARRIGMLGQSLSLEAIEPIELETRFNDAESHIAVIAPEKFMPDVASDQMAAGAAVPGEIVSMDSASPAVSAIERLARIKAQRALRQEK